MRNKSKESFLIVFAVALTAIILIVSTVILNRNTQTASEESINSLGEFYLQEMAERNVNEISTELGRKKEQMMNAIEELDEAELSSEADLRHFLSMVQHINGLNMFAFVDEMGRVYTAENTFSGLTKLGFLSDEITESVIYTTSSFGSKAMVLLAVPMEEVRFGDTHLVACFTGVDADRIVSTIHSEVEQNQVYCSLFNKNGDCIVSPNNEYENYNFFDGVQEEGFSFYEEYSIEKMKEDWQEQQEGYMVYMAPVGNTYTYYMPVEGTDWLVSVRLRHSIIETQVSDASAKIYEGSLHQLFAVIAAMALVSVMMSKMLHKNQQTEYQRSKEEALRIQEQKAAEELREALVQAEFAREQNRLLAEDRDKAFRLIHETLRSGMWRMDFDENGSMRAVRWSDEFRQMLGYDSAEEFPDSLDSWITKIYSEDREMVLDDYFGTINDYSGGRTHDIEYRMRMKSGEWRWFHGAGRLSRRPDGTPESFVGIFVDITEQRYHAERENILEKFSMQDRMTGLGNRRAYESNVAHLVQNGMPDNMAVLALDVNGLKVVNDTKGHKAGDELIKGAASVLQYCLGSYGYIFRTGGDEFTAIITAEKRQLPFICEDLNKSMAKWKGSLVKELTISYGIVTRSEFPTQTFDEMLAEADKRMYEDKERRYREKGVDRKGQQAAMEVLKALYTKILRVNLTGDSYSVIKMEENKRTAEKGFSPKISDWFRNFGNSGLVHEEDKVGYLKRTNIDNLRRFFAEGHRSFSLHYRRRIGDVFCQVMMEMVPDQEYTNDAQSVFLYVKNID